MSKINDIASEDFLTYATEVIKSRAIPYADDNLKPVHRRILYGMYLLKVFSNKPKVKSARITGDVMGKFHPHGDSSIYEAMIRLSQTWKMRYPLVDVQGNAGSIAGDGPAASRYTEANLTAIGDLMVEELKHKAVDYMATYDNTDVEPVTLTSIFPNILCNGNLGIAVGMSSDIVPHNLREAVDAIIAYIDNNAIQMPELMKHMPGPDFPTGAVITTPEKIQEIYETGRGTLTLRSKYDIEHVKGRAHLVFTEIPYLVSIEDKIIQKIHDLVNTEELKDVEDIIDNTGRNRIEIRVILSTKANVRKVLQILFAKTGLQNNIKVNNTVIIDNKPKQLGLKALIQSYVAHRHKMIRRISIKQKEKAEKRLHLVDGLLIAMQDIDGVIKLIKSSSNKSTARVALMKEYKLTAVQADGILDMKLSQLTKLDADKLMNEKKGLEKEILRLNALIHVVKSRDNVIKAQLLDMKNTLGDARRTLIESTSVVAMNESKKLRIVLHKDNKVHIYRGRRNIFD
jgi:DNA gyrase subunit A